MRPIPFSAELASFCVFGGDELAKRSAYQAAQGNQIEVVIPEPNAKQKQFFEAKTRFIGYGGAKAGGKSWAVRMKAFAGTQCWPGIRILIMRQHYSELEKGMIMPLVQFVPSQMATYNNQTHVMSFTNGSIIVFGHWNGEQSKNEYQGLEFDWIFMDEATQFSEEAFWYLNGCCRGTKDIPRRFYITCNPKNWGCKTGQIR